MQKKLISLAIAGALAVPGAAMADVTSKNGNIEIYGKLHASWDFVDNQSELGGYDQALAGTFPARDGDDDDDNTAVFRNSRLGFRGTEDLGGGLKAIWQVETHLDTGSRNGNTGNVGLRNTFVGLQSDSWGRIFMGRHDTPYKTATAKLDIFTDTIADYNNIIGAHMGGPGVVAAVPLAAANAGTGNTATHSVLYYRNVQSSFNERDSHLLAYETPDFNGFKAQIARMSVQSNEFEDAQENEGWSFMAMYDKGPWFASLAYEQFSGDIMEAGAISQTNAAAANVAYPAAQAAVYANNEDSQIDAWKIGLGYEFGNTLVNFVYEDISHDQSESEFAERDAFWIGAAHKFGNNVLKVAWGRADDSDTDNNRDDDEADNWSIGIDHHFSKRTKVYAIYSYMDNDDDANYGLYASDNSQGSWYNPGPNRGQQGVVDTLGSNVSAFSVGIVHNF